MPHTTLATIDLAAIGHNLATVKQLAPHSKIMAVIKADAYGHGIEEVAKVLVDAEGLAVARLEEALQLRNINNEQRILLLGGFVDLNSLQLCALHRIDVVVHSWTSVEILLAAKLATPVNIWLKHNSGMHRLGLTTDEFRSAERRLREADSIDEIIFMTHFSGAEENDNISTDQQLKAFQKATQDLSAPRSLANSAAIIRHQHSQADWVRPGIMLFGANPLSPESQVEQPVDLRPAMTLSSTIIAIRNIEKNETVGYNSRWTAERPTRLATVAIGYGDGYPRHACNGTPVLVNGQRAKLVGTVSMDLITIDISDCHHIEIGDKAILWGVDNNGESLSVEEIADHADTISYQLLTSVSKRVARVYKS